MQLESPPLPEHTESPAPAASSFGFPALGVRDLLAVLFIVVLADLTIYWGQGYAGIAVFLAGAMAAFCLAKFPPRGALVANAFLVVTILALAARLVWYGSPLRGFIGFLWLLAFATAAHGVPPYIVSVIALIAQSFFAGFAAWIGTFLRQRNLLRTLPHLGGVRLAVNILLPLGVCLGFTVLFVLANPDAVTFLQRQLEQFQKWVEWFVQTILRPTELMFWIGVAWLSAGLLKPLIPFPKLKTNVAEAAPQPALLFTACRNTLVMVNVLFAGYLCIEFITLWTREIPPGFYYAGYAHAGAAWLTVALAMATVVLSLIFTGSMSRDPRLSQLHMLASLWSLQNLLLALSVFNRLFIYINFNGMTHMRIVGLLGVSLVVAGFGLVIWKIMLKRTFVWLVQGQLWALAIAFWVYAQLPVDYLAAAYNVQRLQQGHEAAVMQIGVQELDLEGVLALLPLLDHPTEEIREGVAARVAEAAVALRAEQPTDLLRRRGPPPENTRWTAHQSIRAYATRRFEERAAQWQPYEDPIPRADRLERFRVFAFRYY